MLSGRAAGAAEYCAAVAPVPAHPASIIELKAIAAEAIRTPLRPAIPKEPIEANMFTLSTDTAVSLS
jgi:hypothetical protein